MVVTVKVEKGMALHKIKAIYLIHFNKSKVKFNKCLWAFNKIKIKTQEQPTVKVSMIAKEGTRLLKKV